MGGFLATHQNYYFVKSHSYNIILISNYLSFTEKKKCSELLLCVRLDEKSGTDNIIWAYEVADETYYLPGVDGRFVVYVKIGQDPDPNIPETLLEIFSQEETPVMTYWKEDSFLRGSYIYRLPNGEFAEARNSC